MDSCNSGSLQSSSGGDEEYDSRAAVADSLFMSSTRPPPHVLGSISNQPPLPPPMFDPLSNYVQLHQNLNNSSLLINPNISWPRPTSLRSDPNSHDIINPMLSTSPPPFMSAFQTPAAVGSADNNSPGTAQNPNQTAARNPKKRSRASRRAPTTVLTTDTTNFRAMVQEFTGIPAPPFNSSSFPRTRLDLFGTRSSALDAAQPPPPPYLRRSFPQKVQSPPSFLASSSSSLLNSTTNNINIFSSVPSTSSSSASSSTTPVNYQLPITQSPNLFNIPNPLLTSLLQTNPKFLFSSSSAMAAKPLQGSFDLQIPSNNIKIGGLEEFSLGPGNHVAATLSDLPNLISTDQIGARGTNDRDDHHNTDNNNNAGTWRNNGVNRHDEGDDYQAQIRPVNGGNYNNGKINYSASSSDFHGEKGPENVASRGEGMVESWICSSE
ncbi:hypothetical protein Sango_0239200 [Sesamum angolense]|uniref:VQ domain-containing protein n=1 Tax=Sesamum angolense TaxID=2727404 RepID=A0AAE2C788_9LAMI|nr:hypothetical protein Sango_0239200 [Sesamum angolense]